MTQLRFYRRRVLQISGAAICFAGSGRAETGTAIWQGRALGADAMIKIAGLSQTDAGPLFAEITAEIARLEQVFSLYLANSELSLLNAKGDLVAPSEDLLAVLGICRDVHLASESAFDPTVQSIWRKRATGQQRIGGAPGYENVIVETGRIGFARAGMALTLNGIAQGYITDKVAQVLRDNGLRDVVVDTGEIMALGSRPDGTPWRAGVAAPSGALVARTKLTDRALATSSPFGTKLGNQGHILDPRTGVTPRHWETVAVSHDSAAMADSISTAASLLPDIQLKAFISQLPGTELVFAG